MAIVPCTRSSLLRLWTATSCSLHSIPTAFLQVSSPYRSCAPFHASSFRHILEFLFRLVHLLSMPSRTKGIKKKKGTKKGGTETQEKRQNPTP